MQCVIESKVMKLLTRNMRFWKLVIVVATVCLSVTSYAAPAEGPTTTTKSTVTANETASGTGVAAATGRAAQTQAIGSTDASLGKGPSASGAAEPATEAPFVRPAHSGWLVFLYGVLLVGFVFGLMVWDMQSAYRAAKSIREKLLEKLGPGAPADQVRLLADDLTKALPGIPGLARSTLTFAIILILGIVIFHLVTFGGPGFNPGESGKLVHDVVMLLAGGLTSITAFYFGGRAVQEGASGAAPATSNPTPTLAGITKVSPDAGPIGTAVTIVGTNFGQKQGQVKFGATDAVVKSWSETAIETAVPGGLAPGSVTITINPVDGMAVTSAPGAFKVT